jgi:tetratricopeptide (TPR) repeat protein
MGQTTAPATPGPSRIEAEVQRTHQLLQRRQFAQALGVAEALLAEVPENRDVLYLTAVAQRGLGRTADALATLSHFEKFHPDFGRVFQERGHCLRATGDAAGAVVAYRQAVFRNHTLVGSWRGLAELLPTLGENAEAEIAASHLRILARLPAEVVTATSLFAEGELFASEQLIRQFLLKHPTDVEAMRLLAQIGMKREVLDDADFLLENVLQLAPDYNAARYDYVNVLLERHRYAGAIAEARKLLAVDPDNVLFRTAYGNACVGLGKLEEAVQTFRELLPIAARPADVHLSIAHALKTLGRQAEAIESYRAAAAARPGFGDAYWSLANLKTYRFPPEELAAMRAFESSPGSATVDRYHLCFALGKALEDQGDYAESFACYARGNSLKKLESRFSIESLERGVQAQRSLCTREFFAARAGQGCDRADPIFIVGLPRAGSTLLEQILASHSQVEGTMELVEIPSLVHHLNGREQIGQPGRYPAILAQLDAAALRRCGEKYLADTQAYRHGKPYFIDKMPNNFRHLGLIHLMLPNARIIDARREAMACCFSNFKQLFASGQEFTYSLEDIARYYRAYVQLMAHWDAVLPGRVLRVQHEELVTDFEPQVRRILEFCGLPFEAACLEFYKTERSIRTASSEQVRQPISKEGLDQWRNFEPWLGPLRHGLGDLAAPPQAS